jgi:hypothetical protein
MKKKELRDFDVVEGTADLKCCSLAPSLSRKPDVGSFSVFHPRRGWT